jgi:hypothetical protein
MSFKKKLSARLWACTALALVGFCGYTDVNKARMANAAGEDLCFFLSQNLPINGAGAADVFKATAKEIVGRFPSGRRILLGDASVFSEGVRSALGVPYRIDVNGAPHYSSYVPTLDLQAAVLELSTKVRSVSVGSMEDMSLNFETGALAISNRCITGGMSGGQVASAIQDTAVLARLVRRPLHPKGTVGPK